MTAIELMMENTTPKCFWDACKKYAEENGFDLPCDSYKDWKNNGYHNEFVIDRFIDSGKIAGSYNIEFNLENEKKGWGYLYLMCVE